MVNPHSAPSTNKTINAILPPFEPFLVAIETIPPANKIIATISPAEPPLSPFSAKEFEIPAAQD